MSDPQNTAEQRIPVTVLTGFLGSGKTTLLNKLLRRPELADTAVIINEFGEIGLDHLLVEKSDDEGMVTLNSGCLCCTVRGDLVRTMSELFLKRSKGEVSPFKRKSVSIHWELMFTRSLFDTPDMGEQGKLLDEVARLVDAGTLRSTFAKSFGTISAANLKRAHALIESGRAKGKIVLAGWH